MPLRHDMRRGAACLLLSSVCFAVMSAMAKGLYDTLPVAEIMFFRAAFALPVVAAIALRNGVTLRTRRFSGHLVRAIAGTTGMTCGFVSLSLLPLAEQSALNYTTPLFVTLLSIVFLGEKVGIHRWGAVVVGFLGILVIAFGERGGPGGEALPILGIAVAAMGGLAGAAVTLLVRQLSATEASSTIVLWQSLLMTTGIALVVPFVWVPPSWGELGILVAMGVAGGLGQVLLTEAYSSAQVSALGPYVYTGLIWSALLGWIFWGDIPGPAMILGAALIVAAGLYILHRELQLKRRGNAP
jgi:drug/metabolite transporter (DMT)-like permease